MSFIVTGLPRSRTAWFAALFTALGKPCSHELTKDCNSLSDFKSRLKLAGTADSGVVLIKRTVNVPTVVIHRPVKHVVESLGVTDKKQIQFFEDMETNSLSISGLHVTYCDIDERIHEIISHCVGDLGDYYTVKMMQSFNIQRTNHNYSITDWALNLVKEF